MSESTNDRSEGIPERWLTEQVTDQLIRMCRAFAGVALVMSISHVLLVKKFLSLHATHTEQHGTEQDQEKMR